MNRDLLKAKLTSAKLVLGDVKETCRTFSLNIIRPLLGVCFTIWILILLPMKRSI
jgi:hypothetical protein